MIRLEDDCYVSRILPRIIPDVIVNTEARVIKDRQNIIGARS